MIALLGTYLLPLKYSAPCAALLLAATLHGAAQQCGLECRGPWQAEAAELYSSEWRPVPLQGRRGWPERQPACTAGGTAAARARSPSRRCRDAAPTKLAPLPLPQVSRELRGTGGRGGAAAAARLWRAPPARAP